MELAPLKQEFATVYLALQRFKPVDGAQRARQEHLLTAGRLIGTTVNTGQRFAPMLAAALTKLLGFDVEQAGAGIAATMAVWIEAARSLMANSTQGLSGFETAISWLPWILLLGGAALVWWGVHQRGKA